MIYDFTAFLAFIMLLPFVLTAFVVMIKDEAYSLLFMPIILSIVMIVAGVKAFY